MKNVNRRTFIGKSVMGFGGALALSQLPGLLRAHAVPGFLDFPIGIPDISYPGHAGERILPAP